MILGGRVGGGMQAGMPEGMHDAQNAFVSRASEQSRRKAAGRHTVESLLGLGTSITHSALRGCICGMHRHRQRRKTFERPRPRFVGP